MLQDVITFFDNLKCKIFYYFFNIFYVLKKTLFIKRILSVNFNLFLLKIKIQYLIILFLTIKYYLLNEWVCYFLPFF